jgi:dTDP-6-deoxy-L-talose 4-dehydrogenase (NAD+)
MKDRVLLTGATGFVGRHVLRALIKRGVQVSVIVRDEKHSLLSEHDCIKSIVTSPNLFAESSEWWANVCKDIDTVIHLAWYAEHGKYIQSSKNIDCLIGTMQLAKGAVEAGLRRFIGIGTCLEYDLTGGRLSTETPLRPLTTYAGTKVAAFTALSNWLPQEKVEFAWCRLFYLFGDGEDPRRLVPYLHSKLAAGELAELTSGSKIRDFLDVQDAAEMIVNVALSDRQGPINICSGIPTTIRQISHKIADTYGRHDLLKFGVRLENIFDPPCVVGVLN